MTTFLLMTVIAATPPQSPPMRVEPPEQAPAIRVETRAPTYADVLRRVEAGESVTVYVGQPVPKGATGVRLNRFDGRERGVFRCFLKDGEAKYEESTPATSAKNPATPDSLPEKSTRAAGKVVKGHEHRCPFDGTTWSHADDDPNASHDCPTCGRRQLNKSRASEIPLIEAKPVPSGNPKRVVIGGYYYDRYPDGTLVWCTSCNAGR